MQNADDHRAFFDSVFRLFLQHCFGLGKPKDTSWLYIVSKNPKSKEAIQLRQLLEPSGVLMKAITEADERGLFLRCLFLFALIGPQGEETVHVFFSLAHAYGSQANEEG